MFEFPFQLEPLFTDLLETGRLDDSKFDSLLDAPLHDAGYEFIANEDDGNVRHARYIMQAGMQGKSFTKNIQDSTLGIHAMDGSLESVLNQVKNDSRPGFHGTCRRTDHHAATWREELVEMHG